MKLKEKMRQKNDPKTKVFFWGKNDLLKEPETANYLSPYYYCFADIKSEQHIDSCFILKNSGILVQVSDSPTLQEQILAQ